MKGKIILVIAVCVGLFIVPQVYAAYGIDQYTKLMIHSDTFGGDTVFTDSSSQSHTFIVQGDVHRSTGQVKFGNTSIFFDGSDDYLNIPDSDDWYFKSEDFTVDFWVNYASFPTFFGFFGQSDNPSGIGTRFLFSNNQLSVEITTTAGNLELDTIALEGWNTGRWYHMAVVKDSDIITIYRDGLSVGAKSGFGFVVDQSVPFSIGTCFRGVPLSGYIDEFRVSKGIARWTEDFTPPSEPYVPIPGGVWLLGSGLIGLLGFRKKLRKR